MDNILFKRGRGTLILIALVGALMALAFAVVMGAASQSAQAKTRHHARHTVHRSHARSADSSTTADNESGATTDSDGPGGPNDQSGDQSGPNDQSGDQSGANDTTGADTETNSSESESSTGNDPAGGSNCVDNAGCQ